jgi:uncharacterized membrane protein YfcA
MRNSIVKRAVKITVIIAMLAIGAYIGMWNNAEADKVADSKQYGTVNTFNNWRIIVPMILVTVAFIPAGYLLGRKIDKAD